MRRIAIAIGVLALIGAISAGRAGVEKPKAASRPIDALIVRLGVLPRGEVAKVQAFRIADKAKLAALEEFFPGYRDRPTSNVAGGWIAGHHVYFNFPGGETIRVTVSENDEGRSWTVGNGDFATKGNFARFFAGLDL